MKNTESLPYDCGCQTRRAFLKQTGILLTSGAVVVMAGCDSTDPSGGDDGGSNSGGNNNNNTVSVDLTQHTQLAATGGFLLLAGQKVVVVNAGNGTFRAFTSVCTHQQCNVSSFNASTQRMRCPCHGSEFDLNGNPVAGPAPSALTQFSVSRNGDVLTIQK